MTPAGRRVAPFVALAVLLPVTVAVIGWNETEPYFMNTTTFPVSPDTADGTVELAGATFGPIRAQVLDDTEGLTVPDGTRVVVAVIPVDPAGEEVGCDSPVLIEQGTGRQWNEMRYDLGLDWSSEEPTSCDTLTTEPYTMLLPYIVPDDAEGPFHVEIEVYDATPQFVQFSIDP